MNARCRAPALRLLWRPRTRPGAAVGRRKKPIPGKRRTREHVIADLDVNHVERFLLRCGCSVLWTDGADYGLDLFVSTFDDRGELEHGEIRVQIKATDQPAIAADGTTLGITVGIADLKFWAEELLPVLLVVYDARRDRAYWLHVQRYVEEKAIDFDDVEGDSVRLRVPLANRLNGRAVQRVRVWKNTILADFWRKKHG